MSSVVSGQDVGESGDRGSAAWVGAALEASVRTRAPGVHASTPMVRQLAARVARELRLDAQAASLLDVSVRVRDVGMLALPDPVVLATTPLSPADWEVVNRHPVIGAELLEGLQVAALSAQIVRSHHERWDGGGYPDGHSGEAIPLLSRVIATCDAFVAIASDRPHRRGIGAEAALDHVCQERGAQFDPRIVDALVRALTEKSRRPSAARGRATAPAVTHDQPGGARAVGGARDLTTAIAAFDRLPAFAPACDRILAAIASSGTTGGDVVSAVESDTGLTVAILRRAGAGAGKPSIGNVADAVAALSFADIEQTIVALPRAEFPWRTSKLEALMHRSRVHAQAVARAADRITQEVQPNVRDDVLTAALLHDVGKLVFERVRPDYAGATAGRTTTPEARARHEQQIFGMDHASLGGLLVRRWKLPDRLASTIATHHSAEAAHEVATYVRLADMVAHHAQGETVDRSAMLRLAEICGLSANALRDVLFDLPQSSGSQRRRCDPSPLSDRETSVLRVLAQGKVYKEIALELAISTSTIRTHLHNTYAKLGVEDRAQAVLRATERGWL